MPDDIDPNRTSVPHPFALACEPDRSLKCLRHALFETIERDFRDRNLRPGARLEPDAALASRYGTTSTAVSDTLGAFATTRLVDRQPDMTVLKRRPVQWLIRQPSLVFPGITEQFEMRLLVAPECAERARDNATAPDVFELRRLSNCLSARAAAGEVTFEEERAFNLVLAEASGNPILIDQTRQLWHLMSSDTWRLIRGSAEGPAERAATAADYAAIAEAVMDGTGTPMRHHLRRLDHRYFRGRAVGGGAVT